jgi:two-component system sensor histidine kinase KdpD
MHGTLELDEFDLDVALKRNPDLILVDELAHTNASGMRHKKRYQDIEELLKFGIDVYTTINVQHIESLNDVILGVTGIVVQERIPDYVFDMADNIELIDIEPEELLERLNKGSIYEKSRVSQAKDNFFKRDNLFALREIALRRTADKVNNEVEEEKLLNSHKGFYTNEVILTCISSSPNNPSVIRAAKRLTSAFKGKLIALYVEKSSITMSDANRDMLQTNMKLAEDLGARIVTVYGDDIALQIAEYARVGGVSKIVLGRSMNRKIMPFMGKKKLVDQLINYVPSIDIFIIPDAGDIHEKIRFNPQFSLSLYFKDFLKAGAIIIATSLLSLWLFSVGVNKENLLAVYFLGVLLSAITVKGIFYNLLTSIMSVLCYNFFFIEPRWTFETYDIGYPFTVALMFIASMIVSTLTTRIQFHAKEAAIKSYRTNVLLETTQQLQNAKSVEEIYNQIAQQIISLLDYNVIIYPQKDNILQKPFTYDNNTNFNFSKYINNDEMAVARWVFKNNRHAGFSTNTLPGAKCLYLAIRGTDDIFGVIGIVVDKGKPLSIFEKNLLIAMLTECGMSIERIKSIQEYNDISQESKREKLRYNLLRSISHDLRTPLTGISGSAMMLMENANNLSKDKLNMLYEDIYEDSNWLIQLSENLLSMTRLENREIELHLHSDIVEDIINEAIALTSKRYKDYKITFVPSSSLLMANMDSRLLVQVLVNLIDNAIKYSKNNHEVVISTREIDNNIQILVADQGKGISEEAKQHIFDLFYTEHNGIGDSRRSVGLGLYLCYTIMEMHHGSIQVVDNEPQGSVFIVTLPESEDEQNGDISY